MCDGILQEIDKLLIKWDRACDALEGAEADYEACLARGYDHRPTLRLGCLGLGDAASSLHIRALLVVKCRFRFCLSGVCLHAPVFVET
jgi:hypothetical protein